MRADVNVVGTAAEIAAWEQFTEAEKLRILSELFKPDSGRRAGLGISTLRIDLEAGSLTEGTG